MSNHYNNHPPSYTAQPHPHPHPSPPQQPHQPAQQQFPSQQHPHPHQHPHQHQHPQQHQHQHQHPHPHPQQQQQQQQGPQQLPHPQQNLLPQPNIHQHPSQQQESLPPNFVKAYDGSYQRWYYYDHLNDVSHWELPATHQPNPSYTNPPLPPYQPNPEHQNSYPPKIHNNPSTPPSGSVLPPYQPNPEHQNSYPPKIHNNPSTPPSGSVPQAPGYVIPPPPGPIGGAPPVPSPIPTNPSNPNIQHQPTISPGPSLYNIPTNLSFNLSEESAVYVELELRAVGLKDRDIIGKSDPICYVQIPVETSTIVIDKQTKWKTIGKTEVLKNTVNPNWEKRIRYQYLFEHHQPIRFYLIDVDNARTLRGDELGHCYTDLGQVMRNGSQSIALHGGKGPDNRFGKLIVRAHDENAAGKVRLDLTLSGRRLQNVELILRKSDPFFRISCVLPGGNAGSVLSSSEHVRSNLNPQWKPLRVIVPTGGHAWDKVDLIISVWDWNSTKEHRKIGDVTVTLAQLLKSSSLELKSAQRRKKSAGEIIISESKAVEMPSFVSFIQGGLRLKFIVAVDFTASNKPAHRPDSLHYSGDPSHPSIYAQALNAVGTVVSSYIPDGYITALGFGAKLPGKQVAVFDFALTGKSDPRVIGVEGLLNAYKQATDNVKFSGPTLFTPLIRNVMSNCENDPVSQQNQNFTVLLIITDGIITDYKETINTIIDASYVSPMSIVIVGVGNADFMAMKQLDGDDDVKLKSLDKPKVAKYDIVQFTKFEASQSLESIAADVLHEVPQRLVEYMVDANIKPNIPPQNGEGPSPAY